MNDNFEISKDKEKGYDLIYPEIRVVNDGFTTPLFPGSCPVCGASAIDDMAYACGGKYERKAQVQQHHKVWWGVCGK